MIFLTTVVASMALAQGKPPAIVTRDAGVPPPARSTSTGTNKSSTPAADGGVTAATPSAPTPGPISIETERLRKELNDLKLRTTELECQAQSKTDGLSGELEKMNRKLDELSGRVKQLSDAADRRADVEEAAVTRKTSTAAATTSLNSVLSVLASGNTSNVEPSLRYAEGVFTGNAQRDVQLARAALANGDVSMARQYLLLAIAEAEAQR